MLWFLYYLKISETGYFKTAQGVDPSKDANLNSKSGQNTKTLASVAADIRRSPAANTANSGGQGKPGQPAAQTKPPESKPPAPGTKGNTVPDPKANTIPDSKANTDAQNALLKAQRLVLLNFISVMVRFRNSYNQTRIS